MKFIYILKNKINSLELRKIIFATSLFSIIYVNNINYAIANNEQINKKILDIKKNINDSTISLNKYSKRVGELKNQINIENKNIIEIKKTIKNTEEKQKELNIILNNLENSLKSNQDIIQKFLITIHKHNNHPKLKLLISEDIFNWSLLFNYLKYLNQHEKQKFDSIIKQLQEITEVYNKVNTNKVTLSKQHKSLEDALNKLLILEKQEVSLRDSAKKDIESNKNKLAELLKLIESKNIKNSYNKNISKSNFQKLKKSFIMPIDGKILEFNEDSNESRLTQNGIFIKTNNNHKFIHAIYDGKVVFADWLKLYGNVVIVDHMNGYMSLYANNEKNLTKVGSFIQAGEQIAVKGNSGEFGQQGSYFELRHQGKPLNPIKWLKIG